MGGSFVLFEVRLISDLEQDERYFFSIQLRHDRPRFPKHGSVGVLRIYGSGHHINAVVALTEFTV